jgi:iodotyrosine deiodinase
MNNINFSDSFELLDDLKRRRTFRSFSNELVDEDIILNCIKIASLAPSGANMQPWTYVLIKNKDKRREIRIKCEEIEKDFYENKIPDEWEERLKPLGTNYQKPFLEDAPFLVAVFSQSYGIDMNNNKIKHYFVQESANLSVGFFIYSLHLCGLSTLTYTPTPNNFLNNILNRPHNEKALFLMPIGYPDPEYKLPEISKKNLNEFLIVI